MNLSKDDLVRIQTAVMSFIDMHHDAARIARQTADANEEAAILQDVAQYDDTKNKIDELIRTGNLIPVKDKICRRYAIVVDLDPSSRANLHCKLAGLKSLVASLQIMTPYETTLDDSYDDEIELPEED